MQVSARNVFTGTLTAVVNGAVNAEVELTTAGGDKLVAVVTEGSVKSLDLAVGTPVVAYVKAPLVMLLVGVDGMRFSARNQLSGTVSALTRGAVNTEVAMALAASWKPLTYSKPSARTTTSRTQGSMSVYLGGARSS